MMNTTLYTVKNLGNGDVKSGLTKTEAISCIWNDDGKTILCKPRMESVYNNETGECEGEQQVCGQFGLEWNVFERTGNNTHGGRHIRTLTAYGDDEDAALENLYLDAWNRSGYDQRDWSICTDAEHMDSEAQARLESEQE